MSIATKIQDATKILNRIPPGEGKRWKWYHGALFYGAAQAVTFGLGAIINAATGKKGTLTAGDPDYFRSLKQSIIAPPAWVFGPAWTINNISVIWGTLQVLNKPEDTPGRTSFLALQGASWLNYIVFNAAYFSLRSPINAFILTLSMFILTMVSGLIAIFQLKDTKVALSLATLMIWLMIALTVASFQASWNYDELYHVGPFFEVEPRLEKKAK